jgi:hypothetical protein
MLSSPGLPSTYHLPEGEGLGSSSPRPSAQGVFTQWFLTPFHSTLSLSVINGAVRQRLLELPYTFIGDVCKREVQRFESVQPFKVF